AVGLRDPRIDADRGDPVLAVRDEVLGLHGAFGGQERRLRQRSERGQEFRVGVADENGALEHGSQGLGLATLRNTVPDYSGVLRLIPLRLYFEKINIT